MKPIFDISGSKNFTVWESGCWNESKRFGYSVLVADADGSPVQVIYDRDPKKGMRHALFFANLGRLLIGSYVIKKAGQLTFHLDMIRIANLSTEVVQGRTVPRAETTNLYLSRVTVDEMTFVVEDLLADMPDMQELFGIRNAKELMTLAIEKSMTPAESQRIYYGIPRKPNDE